jgi:zinc finger SWIM domain-containing protein 3
VQEKRNKELDKEFEARKKLPRLRMRTPMLVQASKFYTPPIFEAFQVEYERSMAACTRALEENNIYDVAIVRSDGDLSSEIDRVVVGDLIVLYLVLAISDNT